MATLRAIDHWFVDEVLPHEASFFAAARWLTRDRDGAEDLVHDVYVKLYAMDGWASITAPRSYILRMLRNLSIERVRRTKVVQFQHLSDIEGFDVSDDRPCQFRIAAAKDAMARVATVLAKMPERCRVVLIRRRFDQQPPKEIAAELGVSLSTLEKRLARAVALLAKALEPDPSRQTEEVLQYEAEACQRVAKR